MRTIQPPAKTQPRAVGHGLPVLVVDDSPMQRRLLCARLERMGHACIPASDGAEALALQRETGARIIISDAMMPGMSGAELCEALRRGPGGADLHVILVSAGSDDDAVGASLSAGADDHLLKPISDARLRLRLHAAARALGRGEALWDEALRLTDAHDRLTARHREIDADLDLAACVQRALMPAPDLRVGTLMAASINTPAGRVGGDALCAFRFGRAGIGVVSADVSGHGVAAGLMAIRLAGFFDPADPRRNIALTPGTTEPVLTRDPAEVMADLNARLLVPADHDVYATLALAIVDGDTGHGRVSLAGHPHPLLQAPDGEVTALAEAGPPVGLLADMTYTSTPFTLAPGARMVLFSDGLEPAPAQERPQGPPDWLRALARIDSSALPGALIDRARNANAKAVAPDDLSVLVLARYA